MSSHHDPALAAPRMGRQAFAVVLASMAAGAIYSAVVGQDANWDWQNYHEYNVWALLHGGYARDAIPPGFQTYFNPYIYFPWYALRHGLPPLAAGAIMGAVHGLNLALIYWLTRHILGAAANAFTIGAAVLLAMAGPMTLSEVGTSFADIVLSIPMIAGLTIMLASDHPKPSHYLCTGLLFGLALGFKLTNIVFALGLGVAALAATRPLIAMCCIALGGAVGTVISGGGWSLMLWREFGNPFFPLMNGLLPSPEMQQITLLDRQFTPRGFLDGLAYPFHWLIGDNRSSELPFRDARFALAFVLVPIALAVRIRSAATLFTRRDLQFLIFLGTSFAAWLALFSIQRYAVALELLVGPAIVLLLVRISAAFGFPASAANGRRSSVIILVIAVMAAFRTQPTDWWHRPWSNPYRPEIPAQLSQPATYFLLDKPLSYVAAVLPLESRFYTIADVALPIIPGGIFDRRIRAGLQSPLPGGVWEMHIKGRDFPEQLLSDYGLMIDRSQPCAEIEGANLGSVNVACPLIAHQP